MMLRRGAKILRNSKKRLRVYSRFKVTVFEFLESADLAYLGWGNSIQKANRLYST